MKLEGKRIGFAMTGSFCTIANALEQMKRIKEVGAELYPIFSENVYTCDTRFYKAEDLRRDVTEICGREPIHTIVQAEPIGPRKLLDLVLIAPCTGNTVAKMAQGIVDTPVLLAAKAQLRNGGPVVVAVATNDGLGNNCKNIGCLHSIKDIYLVPYEQDDPLGKPNSVVARMDKLIETCELALEGRQLQPCLLQKM